MLLEQMAEAGGGAFPQLALAQRPGYGDVSAGSRSLGAVLRRLRQKSADCGVGLPLPAGACGGPALHGASAPGLISWGQASGCVIFRRACAGRISR